MYGRTDPQQHWSVHAEFTISHPGAGDPENQPQTHTEQGDNGVKMTYTWTSQPPNQSNWSTRSTPPPSGTGSSRSDKSYGFQRGNLLFTSTPPRGHLNLTEPTTNRVQDSGYGSDLLSPNSNVLPRRAIQPYNRKCRSTCNIVLSTNIQDENRTEDGNSDSIHTQCGRTQSLRCQTPTLRCDRKDSFYGCGDPWCHHLHYGDDFSYTGRFSPVLEMGEDCASERSTKSSRSNTLSTVRCCEPSRASIEKDNRKDASVQTFEMIDKCTSPFLKMGSFKNFKEEEKKAEKKKKYGSGRRRTEPIFQRSHSPSSITPDSLDSLQVPRRLTRSPKLEKLPKEKDSANESKCSDASKKPRTVHIDVYCTGTEMESGASSSAESTENETASTPQTVFESQKMRVTHKRAGSSDLPYNLRKSQGIEKKKTEESDFDDGSTAYPSKLSSYSTIRDFSSSISSVPPSWTPFSMSSCTVPDDYDSVANTSWKDTFSDIDSLMQSRSSITQTDSLDFVPRKLYNKNPSIDEAPEIEARKDLLETPSGISIQGSDSFEYANSEDRVRIRKMEELWKNHQKPWKSPHLERRHLLQQKKIKEYLEKRLSDKSLPKWESRESESEASDDEEKGWTIVKEETPKSDNVEYKSTKSPSILAIQKRLSLDPTLRAPFSIVPGVYTDSGAIASKFGRIVPAVRKPGHHVGPVRNPDCLCDHCQRFYADVGHRGRTRSMGDPPNFEVMNWRNMRVPTTESKSNKSVPSQTFK